MKKDVLKLKFKDEENELIFDKKVTFVEDEKLVKILRTENIKNEDSPLMISSMDNINISDVIQLKINVSEAGVFLVNFAKEKVDEKTRLELIEKIKVLKDNVAPTFDTQLAKIKNLLNIIKDYAPIYVSFLNKGSISIGFDDLKNEVVSFPVLFLKNIVKNSKVYKPAHIKLGKREINFEFPLFTPEYLFVSLFAFLSIFTLTCGIYEVGKSRVVGIFLIVLSSFFVGIEYYAVYTSTFKNKKELCKNLSWYLIVYALLGLLVGFGLSLVVVKVILKMALVPLLTILSLIIGLVIGAAGCPASYLINFIIKKIKK